MEEIYYALNPWWEHKKFDFGVLRAYYLEQFKNFLRRRQIEVIIGSRRVGKTTILKQLIKIRLDTEFPPTEILYLALDHPQLSKVPLSEHLKYFRKLFMHDRKKKLLLFLDEVQESLNWEVELKTLYDLENLKIVCAGSTASLIKAQGGKLTGRQIVNTIYPLSFNEYLSFKDIKRSHAEEYKMERVVEDYINNGGYPEYVISPFDEYLINLLDDIIARDVIRLYQIKKANLLKDILRLIAASVGNKTSFNKLANVLGITVDTVKEYIGYLESAFLVKPIEKWTTSYTEKVYAYKKFYFLDTGLKTILTGRGDSGFKAENAVFMHFVRNKNQIGYYTENGKEIDFIIGGFRSPLIVEVKYDSDIVWQDKKFNVIRSLLNHKPDIKKVLIITKDVEFDIRFSRATIKAIPLWRFLLFTS